MKYRLVIILLCIYGFFKEFRPITSFLSKFLTTVKGFPVEVLSTRIYWIWSVANFLFTIPIVLFTDYLNFKPILIIEALALIGTGIFLVFGRTLFEIQLTQVTYGLGTASEIAYMSYLYTIVPETEIGLVTGVVRAVVLISKSMANIFAQFSYSFQWVSLDDLNNITLIGSVVAFPFVVMAVLAHPTKQQPSQEEVIFDERNDSQSGLREVCDDSRISNVMNHIYHQFTTSFVSDDRKIQLTWCVWWIVVSGCVMQMYNFIQVLWEIIEAKDSKLKNGLVEFINNILGAVVTLIFSRCQVNWKNHTKLITTTSTLLISGAFLVLASTQTLYVSYVAYIAANLIYSFSIAVASTVLATVSPQLSIGFVFGIISLLASVLQIILNTLFFTNPWVTFSQSQSFVFYSGICAIFSVIFFLISQTKELSAPNDSSQVEDSCDSLIVP
uniref:MFS domain-containing protein n=1 Tax=Rhabditophanes sp. KR3021 TaxID=114890 RepID=A0AC35TL44_9BILA